MPRAQFFQLDVFTERAGGGNPLGVVLGADDWSAPRMQAFAAWSNLVETTFLLRADDAQASYRLRIFTPQREIAFAGHPSIGSAEAALTAGFAVPRDGQLWQQCQAGLLPIRVEESGPGRRLSVRVPSAQRLPIEAAHALMIERVLAGLPLGALGVALIAGGRRWWLAELADEARLRGWQPDHTAIRALALASDSLGLCVFARSRERAVDLVVRAFPAGVGIQEDPASGAANGLIAAFIRQAEPQGALSERLAQQLRVSQGRELGRDAHLYLHIDAEGEVWIGGHSVMVIRGDLDWR
ncbi:MAG: PhzF family phenazine biosynthesis protein [Lysobacterales bacterium]